MFTSEIIQTLSEKLSEDKKQICLKEASANCSEISPIETLDIKYGSFLIKTAV